MKIFLAAAVAVSTLTFSSAAQAGTCSGKVIADSVYQQGTSGKFEYFVQLRNATQTPVKADISFGNFPAGVSLFSPRLSGVMIGVNAKSVEKLRFGNGANDKIHNGTVDRFYDSKGVGPKPFVLIANCQ